MDSNSQEFVSYKKVVIFGADAVGKTNLIDRMESNTFKSEHEPTENPIEPRRIIFKTQKAHELSLNILEVKIDTKELDKKDIALLEDIIFECQCALFIIDITSPTSFESVKSTIKAINNEKFPYLKKILISNKLDMENNRAVSGFELKEFTDTDKTIESIEISLMNPENLQELYEKMYIALYQNENKLSSNIVSNCTIQNKHQLTTMNTQGQLRIVLLGDSSVGKTAFLTRYFKNSFTENFLSTIGIDDETSVVKVNTDLYKLTVWDTAGQERFRALPKKYYQNADGILLLFDVTKKDTFDNVHNWMKDIGDNTTMNPGEEKKLTIFLLGNKIDMTDCREIEKNRAESEAKNLGMDYFEISCKLNLNITEVMSRIIMECYSKSSGVKDVFALNNKKSQKPKKGDCCGGSKK